MTISSQAKNEKVVMVRTRKTLSVVGSNAATLMSSPKSEYSDATITTTCQRFELSACRDACPAREARMRWTRVAFS